LVSKNAELYVDFKNISKILNKLLKKLLTKEVPKSLGLESSTFEQLFGHNFF